MKSKIITRVLILMLLFAFASAYLPSTASPEIITWLTFWTSPEEVWYWGNVTAAYEALTGVEITMIPVEFDDLKGIIGDWRVPQPDMIYIDAMWVPEFANWKVEVLAIPPDDVQADVKANWTEVTQDGSTWKGFVWGYPGELMSWALVYNRKLFEDEIALRGATTPEGILLTKVLAKLEADVPLAWGELTDVAILLTKWDTTVSPPRITQRGFVPFVEGMTKEEMHQFLSMLWSNGGELLDFLAPEAKFNGTEGKEVMQLYYDLGYVHKVYDPQELVRWPPPPPYWWDGLNHIAMMILPQWMTYIRQDMGPNFTHLGVAPIPIGPSGTESVSVTYNYLNVVTQKAEDEGKAEAAWEFLKWINEPKPAGYIDDIPKHDGTSIMGDFLISECVLPSRISDQADPRLLEDFWKRGFIEIGETYGRSDEYFIKSEQVEYEIGLMFEKVTLAGANPTTTIDDAAAKVNAILPMPGDINLDGPVDIYDAVLLVHGIDATPGSPNWNRGRSDINNDHVVDILDVTILSTNYGKTGDP